MHQILRKQFRNSRVVSTLTYLALLNTSADMGRLPESSARMTEAANTERVERESRTTGTVKRWEVEEEKLREHLEITQTILEWDKG